MSKNFNALIIAKKLIKKRSVTPNDNGCQDYIKKELSNYGFSYKDLSVKDVKNTWLRKGNKKPLIVFAGHTDVVTPGNLSEWETNPFTPTIKDNFLFGRGASDMKSSIAAMVAATQRFEKDNPNHNGSIGFLLTSDEEGPALHGTRKIIEKLKKDKISIDYCIVGEPTSNKIFGDTIKNGRRGSITGFLKIIGIQGHIAYPELAKNPIHIAGTIISKLSNFIWDKGNKYFPKTSCQISSITSDKVASNMIPGAVNITFNLRFSNELTQNKIIKTFKDILSEFDCKYEIEWICSAEPFITKKEKITKVLKKVIKKIINIDSTLSTSGGTSDARFLSKYAKETIEFGPLNLSAHKVNENISLSDLDNLEKIYYSILCELLL